MGIKEGIIDGRRRVKGGKIGDTGRENYGQNEKIGENGLVIKVDFPPYCYRKSPYCLDSDCPG